MIDEMTLADVEMQYAYWAEHPPLGLMIEGFLGVKSSAAPAAVHIPQATLDDQTVQLMALTGAPGIGGAQFASWEAFHAAIGLTQPTFDAKELMAQR